MEWNAKNILSLSRKRIVAQVYRTNYRERSNVFPDTLKLWYLLNQRQIRDLRHHMLCPKLVQYRQAVSIFNKCLGFHWILQCLYKILPRNKAGVTGVVTVVLKSEPFLKDCISSFETFEWVERRQFHTFY